MAWQSQTQTHDRNRKNEERPERVKKEKKEEVVDNLILKKMTLALSYTILVVVISYKVKEV